MLRKGPMLIKDFLKISITKTIIREKYNYIILTIEQQR